MAVTSYGISIGGINPVEKATKVLLQAQGVEARRVAVAFARDQIEDAKRINQSAVGKVPPYVTTVDGRRDAPLESVNLNGGQIITEFELTTGVVQAIAKMLLERSPRRSGDYVRGHTLLADGQPTTLGGNIPPAEEYIFFNAVPYARKIEIGKTKAGRAFVIQVENRIYERTAKDAKAQFGRQVDIFFGYITQFGGATLQKDNAHRSFAGGTLRIHPGQRKDRVTGSAVGAPAITVRLKKA